MIDATHLFHFFIQLVPWGLLVLLFHNYEKARIIVGDFCALFERSHRFFRKSAIQNTIEGNLGVFAKKINSQLDGLIVEKVKVEIVDSKNIESYVNEGVPIIRMNYSHNNSQNITTATLAYINAALLNNARPYLKSELGDAIDLNIVRSVLVDYKRGEAVQYFDENVLDPKIKKSQDFEAFYLRTDEINDEGLLTRILLREYKELAQRLAYKKSSSGIVEETKEFFDFVYNIAVREKDERTELRFSRSLITVGVILVSRIEIFNRHGITPYLRRIKLLAGQGVRSFYLLSRGDNKFILDLVCDELKKDKNFRMVCSKSFRAKGRTSTCALFELDYEGLVCKTKQLLNSAKNENGCLDAIVTKVSLSSVEVDVDGIVATIPASELSQEQLSDARKYFSVDDVLKIKILSVDDISNVAASNKGGDTDPILQIKKQYVAGRIFQASIKDIKDYGLFIVLGDGTEGFIPKQRATYSQFEPLTNMFKVNDAITVSPIRYDSEHKNLVFMITDLKDPWSSYICQKQVGDVVKFKAHVIEQKKIVGELQPGIEGIIFQNEFDWRLCNVNDLKIKVGDEIDAKIKEIDADRRQVLLSRKSLLVNPIKDFYEANKTAKVMCKVTEAIEGYALEVVFDGGVNGRVHVSEIDWTFITDMKGKFPVGTQFEVRINKYDEKLNIIWASRKALISNPAQEFQNSCPPGTIVEGRVVQIEHWGASVAVSNAPRGLTFLLTKGEVTDLCFVEDLKHVYDKNNEYKFVIKAIIPEQQRVLLSRKQFLKSVFGALSLKYGDIYKVRVIGRRRSGEYIVESIDGFQAVALESEGNSQRVRLGDYVDVCLASKNDGTQLIEVNL